MGAVARLDLSQLSISAIAAQGPYALASTPEKLALVAFGDVHRDAHSRLRLIWAG